MEEEFKNLQIVGYEEAVGQCSCVLPGDLIVEILQRLPVKSLLRFESTSKPWQFVIRSSKFIAKHLIHHQEHKKKKGDFNHLHVYSYHVPADCKTKFDLFSLCCYCPPATPGPNTYPGISLISKGENGNVITSALSHSLLDVSFQSVSIVGSSNGLVCIKFSIRGDDPIGWGTCFAIWNPATRKFISLPRPQRVPSVVVANACNVIVGFSYIPTTSNYKLVQILVVEANNVRFSARVQVLNLGENSWREVECQGQDEAVHELVWRFHSLESSLDYTPNQPVVVNGCLHWLGILRHGGVCMVSFDLDKEVFTQTALAYPFNDHVKRTERSLAVFEDNLAVFVSPDSTLIDATKDQEFCFEVWVYDRTGESWTKRFSFGPLLAYERPVGFFGNDEIMIRKIFTRGLKPYLYNLNNKEKKDFPCSDRTCNFAFEPYVESLVEIPE